MAARGFTALVVLLVACRDPAHDVPDATPGGGGMSGCPCAEIPQGIPGCYSSCGNGVVDYCYLQSPMGCHCVTILEEVCDGDARAQSGSGAVTCADLGYYGGSSTCEPHTCSQVDYGSCEACPSDDTCVTLPYTEVNGVATNGTHLAIVGATGIQIFDGLTHLTTVAGEAREIVAIPTGWLVLGSMPPRLWTLGLSGTNASAATSIPTELAAARMVAGPPDRVLLAWSTLDGTTWQIHITIADATGTIVVSPAILALPPLASGELDLASDGASFFVAASGHLARIATDGTSAIVDGYPDTGQAVVGPTVSWSGSAGWYVARTAAGIKAQRFDATGAKLGPELALSVGALFATFVADGADLIAARFTSTRRLELVRVDATGTNGADLEVGAGTGDIPFVRVRNGEAVVGWTRLDHLQLAVGTP